MKKPTHDPRLFNPRQYTCWLFPANPNARPADSRHHDGHDHDNQVNTKPKQEK